MLLKNHSIYSIKLSTNEELVASLVNEQGDALLVTKPLLFTLNPQTGSPVLIPWLFGVSPKDSTTITLNRATVVAYVKVDQELADAYKEVTSGIKKAPASVLQGLKN